MRLEEIMLKLSKFGVVCRTIENAFVVTLKFDKDWTVIEPEDKRVQCKLKNGTYYYAADISDGGSDAVFKAIDSTIAYNESIAKRKELLDIKVKELCRMFAEHEDLEELETLKFVFDKRKRKKNKQQATVSKENENTKENESVLEEETVYDPIDGLTETDEGMDEFINQMSGNSNEETIDKTTGEELC